MAIKEFLEKNRGYETGADQRIAENRVGSFRIAVPSGARVNYKLKRHDFDFGCNIFMMDQYEKEEENERYLERWKRLFNTAVVPLYWEGTEPEKGLYRYCDDGGVEMYRRPPAKRVVDYCKENGITPKGHPLFWHEFIPAWLPKSWDELLPLIEKRFREISELFGDDIPVFDVLNEPSRIWDMTFEHATDGYTMVAPPEGYVEQILELGRKYFPKNELILNDAVSASFCDFRGLYGGYYQLQRRLIESGYKVDRIGLQCHTKDDKVFKNVFLADRLDALLTTYGELGRKVVISEISIPSDIGEDLQAEAVEMLYKVAFANPHVSGVFWWNLDDNGIKTFKNRDALGENLPSAGLIRNGAPKESYRVLDRLINEEWHTEGSASECGGAIEFTGFYGSYEITVENGTETKTFDVSLGKNDPRAVTLPL